MLAGKPTDNMRSELALNFTEIAVSRYKQLLLKPLFIGNIKMEQ